MARRPATEVERVTAAAFDGRRLRRAGVIVVAFLADWCPFCRAFRPEFGRLAPGPEDYGLLVADVTSMESPLWEAFDLEVVPTVVVFRDGKVVGRRDGVAGVGLGSADLEAIANLARAAAAGA
jgi:thioredoxin 1